MDQGNPVLDGVDAVVPQRVRLSPLRAALFVFGAVLGGVALSLILGSAPAHAADDPGAGQNPLVAATSAVTAPVTSTVDRIIPGVQTVVSTAATSVVTVVPSAEPVLTPVATTVGGALTAVDQLVTPVVDSVLPIASHGILTITHWAAAPAATAAVLGAVSGTSIGAVPAALNGSGSDGSLPSPVLVSSSGAPVAALGVLLAIFALALLAARGRLDDDALPASPVFETDTSPA